MVQWSTVTKRCLPLILQVWRIWSMHSVGRAPIVGIWTDRFSGYFWQQFSWFLMCPGIPRCLLMCLSPAYTCGIPRAFHTPLLLPWLWRTSLSCLLLLLAYLAWVTGRKGSGGIYMGHAKSLKLQYSDCHWGGMWPATDSIWQHGASATKSASDHILDALLDQPRDSPMILPRMVDRSEPYL